MKNLQTQSLVLLMGAVTLALQSCSSASKNPSATAKSPVDKSYSVSVYGGDENSFSPAVTGAVKDDAKKYDAVVVGGGLAGLAGAIYLSDHGHQVLLLEKEKHFGGLASGETIQDGVTYDRGAAYWTDAYEEEKEILKHISMEDYKEKYAIPEPIDSYLWKGELYEGIWEHETVEKLPASFALFKYELMRANEMGLIPNQPFEEATDLRLDQLSAKEWVEQMPDAFAKRMKDPAESSRKDFEETKHIWARFKKENAGMEDVIGLLDLYTRSALGTETEGVSAVAFANFYISEIETRFTTPFGTGKAANNMIEQLGKRKNVKLLSQATVSKVVNAPDHVEVTYLRNGKAVRTKARYAIFAAQLKLAPKLIEGFADGAPEQAKLMSKLGYSHYSVHMVEVKGHPYRATYDTWTRAEDYTSDDFTDLILGRWMDPKINGYHDTRDFKKNPADNLGILSIYHPLPQKWLGSGYTTEQSMDIARSAVARMKDLYGPLLQKHWKTKIEVVRVKTNRWPYSVHIAAPGHFSHDAKILRHPYGRIYFANNNLGTPAFEEALFRGHCAANNISLAMNPKFKQESWTKCPVEVAGQ